MSITNITITNVTKGFNLRGVVNELRYEIAALATPEASETEQFTFEIPNATLVTDTLPPPSTTPGNPPSGSGGGGGFAGASIIATIAGGSPEVIFPSLQSKVQVSTASDEQARDVLFRDSNLRVASRVSHGAAQLGLDVIPGATNPGISGTVTVNMVVLPGPLGIVVSIAVQVVSVLK